MSEISVLNPCPRKNQFSVVKRIDEYSVILCNKKTLKSAIKYALAYRTFYPTVRLKIIFNNSKVLLYPQIYDILRDEEKMTEEEIKKLLKEMY